MRIITIQFTDKKEYQFVLNLLRRLNIKFVWREEKDSLVNSDPNTNENIVKDLFGSWPSDKSSDELVKMIYEARVNQTREVNL